MRVLYTEQNRKDDNHKTLGMTPLDNVTITKAVRGRSASCLIMNNWRLFIITEAFLEEVTQEREDAPLLDPQVCVDGGVASCASQVLVFSVGYVLPSAVVPVLLRQTKINEEQLTIKENTHVKIIAHVSIHYRKTTQMFSVLKINTLGWNYTWKVSSWVNSLPISF